MLTISTLLALFSKYFQALPLQFCSVFCLAPSNVFRLSVGYLPDAVLGSAAGLWPPPNASPRRDEVGVASGVREGVGGAAGTSATLEGWCFFLLLLVYLHLVLLPVSLNPVSYRGPDGFMEELDADDGQQADAHRQDDG